MSDDSRAQLQAEQQRLDYVNDHISRWKDNNHRSPSPKTRAWLEEVHNENYTRMYCNQQAGYGAYRLVKDIVLGPWGELGEAVVALKNQPNLSNTARVSSAVINCATSLKPSQVGKKIITHVGKETNKITKIKSLEEGDRSSNYGFSYDKSIFNKPSEWTAPVGTKQTYKVYERKDIDWNLVRTGGEKKYQGITNKEAAVKYGKAPQLNDGSFATLHHIRQDARGPLIEASTRYHGVGKNPGQKILHSQFGLNKKNPDFPVDHNVFTNYDTKSYWKLRGDVK